MSAKIHNESETVASTKDDVVVIRCPGGAGRKFSRTAFRAHSNLFDKTTSSKVDVRFSIEVLDSIHAFVQTGCAGSTNLNRIIELFAASKELQIVDLTEQIYKTLICSMSTCLANPTFLAEDPVNHVLGLEDVFRNSVLDEAERFVLMRRILAWSETVGAQNGYTRQLLDAIANPNPCGNVGLRRKVSRSVLFTRDAILEVLQDSLAPTVFNSEAQMLCELRISLSAVSKNSIVFITQNFRDFVSVYDLYTGAYFQTIRLPECFVYPKLTVCQNRVYVFNMYNSTGVYELRGTSLVKVAQTRHNIVGFAVETHTELLFRAIYSDVDGRVHHVSNGVDYALEVQFNVPTSEHSFALAYHQGVAAFLSDQDDIIVVYVDGTFFKWKLPEGDIVKHFSCGSLVYVLYSNSIFVIDVLTRASFSHPIGENVITMIPREA